MTGENTTDPTNPENTNKEEEKKEEDPPVVETGTYEDRVVGALTAPGPEDE